MAGILSRDFELDQHLATSPKVKYATVLISHLVRVLDVHAEPELLEHPPLGLDDVVLQIDVGGVQDHGLDRPEKDAGLRQSGQGQIGAALTFPTALA